MPLIRLLLLTKNKWSVCSIMPVMLVILRAIKWGIVRRLTSFNVVCSVDFMSIGLVALSL